MSYKKYYKKFFFLLIFKYKWDKCSRPGVNACPSPIYKQGKADLNCRFQLWVVGHEEWVTVGCHTVICSVVINLAVGHH